MKVQELMSTNVVSCSSGESVDEVALKMWNNDCGSIPIVNSANKPIGIVTDRDIAMGATLKHQPLWEITSEDLKNGSGVFTCQTDDDVKSVLSTMQDKQVRRLPVVGDDGQLVGMVSIGDLVSYSHHQKGAKLPYKDTMATLKTVTGHH